MRVALVTPMKPPDHPVPSGDRTFARLIRKALQAAGHTVVLPPPFRTYGATPEALSGILAHATAAVDAAVASFETAPDAVLTYHNYHKAPDLVGPAIAAHFKIPFAIVEASRAPKRQTGPWQDGFEAADRALRAAHALGAVTPRDRPALVAFAAEKVMSVPPFIDTTLFEEKPPASQRGGHCLRAANGAKYLGLRNGNRLFCAAMMRDGRKAESVRLLADAFAIIRRARPDATLTIAGDGPARASLEPLFPAGTFVGLLEPAALGAMMRDHDLFVWPAIGEPFGFTFLEAAAAGLPVIGGASPGVAAVVLDGETGILVPEGDAARFAEATLSLLGDPARRATMARSASGFAASRNLAAGSRALDALLSHARARWGG